jgi:hypothetical protein
MLADIDHPSHDIGWHRSIQRALSVTYQDEWEVQPIVDARAQPFSPARVTEDDRIAASHKFEFLQKR